MARRGEWLAGIGGIALLTGLFAPWFGLDGVNLNAWDELEFGRLVLLATGVLGCLVLAVGVAQRNAQARFLMAVRAAAAGIACSVYVIYRLLHPVDSGLDVRIGAIIGLAGALLVTAGGLLSTTESKRSGTSVSEEQPEMHGRGV